MWQPIHEGIVDIHKKKTMYRNDRRKAQNCRQCLCSFVNLSLCAQLATALLHLGCIILNNTAHFLINTRFSMHLGWGINCDRFTEHVGWGDPKIYKHAKWFRTETSLLWALLPKLILVIFKEYMWDQFDVSGGNSPDHSKLYITNDFNWSCGSVRVFGFECVYLGGWNFLV